MEQQTITPIERSVTVRRGVEDAFRVFVFGIGTWWPADRFSIGHDKAEAVILEPREGGRLYERWSDGTEETWGEVLVFDEPNRLVMTWHPGFKPGEETEIEVTFVADGDDTVVTIVHRGWERLGEGAAPARAGYDGGWPTVLGRFEAAANGA